MGEVQRTKAGKFAPGSSGNPSGRPKGASAELKRQLAERGPEIVETVVARALEGDPAALKLVMDRLTPALRPSAERISVEIPEGADLSDTARAFIDAAANGQLPGDVAAQLVGAIGQTARVIEIDDLARRLEALEAQR